MSAAGAMIGGMLLDKGIDETHHVVNAIGDYHVNKALQEQDFEFQANQAQLARNFKQKTKNAKTTIEITMKNHR